MDYIDTLRYFLKEIENQATGDILTFKFYNTREKKDDYIEWKLGYYLDNGFKKINSHYTENDNVINDIIIAIINNWMVNLRIIKGGVE